MTASEKRAVERLARQIHNCDAALCILASSIDTQLADAIVGIGDMLERISEDLNIMAEAD